MIERYPAAMATDPVATTFDELVARAHELAKSGTRAVLGIAGEPGAGKSTLGLALAEALGDTAVLLGMDGFHLANRELDRLGIRSRKGAPDTFDVDGFETLLNRLRRPQNDVVYAPVFDRGMEESIGSAVPVFPTTPLVIVEGNYLLLDSGRWSGIRALLDEAWYLDVPADVRARRLTLRRQSFGDSVADSERWVRSVDKPNAEVVRPSRLRADLIVELMVSPGAPAETPEPERGRGL
jgi:pantothenate kinase